MWLAAEEAQSLLGDSFLHSHDVERDVELCGNSRAWRDDGRQRGVSRVPCNESVAS